MKANRKPRYPKWFLDTVKARQDAFAEYRKMLNNSNHTQADYDTAYQNYIDAVKLHNTAWDKLESMNETRKDI